MTTAVTAWTGVQQAVEEVAGNRYAAAFTISTDTQSS